MAEQHDPAFVALVDDAKTRIRELSVEQVKQRLDAGAQLELVDVREDREFAVDRARGARHIGRGVLERDVAHKIPDRAAEIVLYCGGGYRSALAADNLQRMGYTNVWSMAGGMRAWRAAGYPLEPSEGL